MWLHEQREKINRCMPTVKQIILATAGRFPVSIFYLYYTRLLIKFTALISL